MGQNKRVLINPNENQELSDLKYMKFHFSVI